MTPAQTWLVVAIVLFILEIITPGFVLANVAVAAMAAAIAAWLDASFTVQTIVFAVTCLISFFTVRPLLHKMFPPSQSSVPTGVDALPGRVAIVTDGIGVPPYTGRVQIDGDSWSARSSNDIPIEVGTSVRIVRVESTTLVVERQ